MLKSTISDCSTNFFETKNSRRLTKKYKKEHAIITLIIVQAPKLCQIAHELKSIDVNNKAIPNKKSNTSTLKMA